VAARTRGVLIAPGATALTRTPFGASSTANVLTSEISPAFPSRANPSQVDGVTSRAVLHSADPTEELSCRHP